MTGLSDSDQQKALTLWKLQPGQPMDGPYVDEFAKAVFKEVGHLKSVAPGMRILPGTDQVAVSVGFK